MSFRYPHPDNEKSFEKFCLKLLKRHWNNPHLELLGLRGEKQFGIDIIDLSASTPFRAAQCKHHEPHMTIPPAEIEEEVAKALTFETSLSLEHYAILTSGKATRHAQNKIGSPSILFERAHSTVRASPSDVSSASDPPHSARIVSSAGPTQTTARASAG